MTGITIAHHDSNDSFVASSPYASTPRKSHAETATVVSNDPISQLLSATTDGEGVLEDLTGEVQSLLMRESMASWLNQPFDNANVDLSGFDAHQLSLQLENLFSQGDLTEMPSPFYDEMMFVPESMSAPMSAFTTPFGSPQMTQEEEIQIVEDEAEDDAITLQQLDDIVSAPPQPEKLEQVQELQNNTSLKRRRTSIGSSSSSSSSEDDSGSSSDESEEEEESPVIPTTVANLGSRQYWSSSSDESESELDTPTTHHRSSRPTSPVLNHQYQTFAYMHKRQIEETLLDKITNQLQPDKLPGILAIISNDRGQQQQASDEVEIDLSCLAREPLVRLLAYVEACIVEQSGGPAVDLANYLVREKKPSQPKKVRMVVEPEDDDDESDHPTTPKRGQQQRSPRRRRQRSTHPATKARSRKSRQELTEDILADEDDEDEDEDDKLGPAQQQHTVKHEGPMSMAQLTKRQAEQERSRRRNPNSHHRSPKRSKKAVVDEDVAVSSSLGLMLQERTDSIAISRPKRRAALHKRRIMEDTFQGSDADDNSEDEGTLIVFSNEQMDFNVKDNKTIVHAPSRPSTPEPVPAPVMASADEEDEDEEIDIML